jgi:hypothetical protein
MAQNYEDNKLTYQQIVMKQITIIQNITSRELRNGEKIIKNLMGEQTIIAEDTRYSFLQAINTLGSLLSPYFSKSNAKEEFDNFNELYDIELITALDDDEFRSKVIKYFKLKGKTSDDVNKEIEVNKLSNQVNTYFLNYKIQEGRRIFRVLVELFKNNDFLSNESYGEGSGSVDDGLAATIDDDEDDDIQ